MSATTLNRPSFLPVLQEDPRRLLSEAALVEASENAFPIVARRVAKRDGLGLAAGAVGAALLGGLTFWSMSEPVPKPVAQREAPRPPVKLAPVAAPAAAASQPIAPATPAQEQAIAAIPQQPAAPSINPAQAPVMVWDTSAPEIAAVPRGAVPPEGAGARVTAPQPLSENESFATRMTDSSADAATATRIVDPANTVTQGTLIPAVLETAINSDLPGYARAVVSQDVRSFDGSKILVPRSSRLIGQYKSGVAAGQTRAYVIWTRLIRPDGVTVPLASPGIEYSGESGLSGEVDSHFFKRFGAAGLLSILGGLGTLATGGTSLILSSGNSAASVAAQRDAQIPPTIKIPQGQPIRVFTARDLDFSSVAGGQ